MAGKEWRLLAAAAALHAAATSGALLTVPQRDTTTDPLATASVDVSANGRHVAFESRARLVPADTNDCRDIYVLDSRHPTGHAGVEPAWRLD